jgi:hypothetical protein
MSWILDANIVAETTSHKSQAVLSLSHNEILQDHRIENPFLTLTLSTPSDITLCTIYKETSKALNYTCHTRFWH